MTKVFDIARELSVPVVAIRSEGKIGDKEATAQVIKYIGYCVNLRKAAVSKSRSNLMSGILSTTRRQCCSY